MLGIVEGMKLKVYVEDNKNNIRARQRSLMVCDIWSKNRSYKLQRDTALDIKISLFLEILTSNTGLELTMAKPNNMI